MTSYKKDASRRSARNEPSPQEINMLVTMFKQGRYTETETLAREMMARFPLHGFGWKAMGTALLLQERNEEALAPLRKAAKLSQGDAQLYNNLGNTLAKLDRLSEAEASYRQALNLNSGFVEAHHNLGNTLLKLGRLPEAEVCYRHVLELKPDYADAYSSLSDILYEQGRLSEAEACYRHVLELKPDCADAYSNLGDVLYEQGRLSEAETSLHQALNINPEHGNSLFGLGTLYRVSGQLERAADLFLQVLKTNPNNMEARLQLALLKKVGVEDTNFTVLVQYWEAAQNSLTPLTGKDAICLHFALGKCYDDSGDYEKAFPHFLEGCKLKRATFNYNPDHAAQQTSGIMHIFDQSTIVRLRGAGDPSFLPIFVLGMPRSGTTLAEQIIASHPDVHGAGELPNLRAIAHRDDTGMRVAFPENLRSLNHATLTAWGKEYVTLLQQYAPDARRITDKMPSNFFAIGLIHLMLPNAKIIHVNRNPVDTCLSCFTKLFTRNQEYTYDLAELGRYYVDYARLMEHWRKVLPAGAFLDVDYEDIVADQEAQTRRMIEYCGLEWNDACLYFHKNERSVLTASTTQVRQPIYKSSMERWRHYEKFLGPLLDALGGLAPKR